MPAVTSSRAVRARIEGSPEPPFDRLFDPLTHALVIGAPLARQRFVTPWADTEALRSLTGKRAPLDAALAEALRDRHRRLGASPESLRGLERLACGEAVCTIAGQQPAPLGGPLYALHKTAAAVGIARRVTARTGVPCVPVYWNHVEDSDFDEIRSIMVADATLALEDLSLPADSHAEGGLVGAIPAAALAELHRKALTRWAGLPGVAPLASLLETVVGRASDLGEVQASLMLALFADQGLVVVDPRLPAFQAAARPIIDRYLDRADALSRAARWAGAALEAGIGRRPLSDAALDSFVFALRDGTRHKVTPQEARALPSGVALSPSVALRPAVQDGVLPTVAMACGPGELAYLAQLKEVFEGLDLQPACPVPRFSATWLPPAAIALLEASSADPWLLVATTDAVLRRHAETRVPSGLRDELDRMRAELAGRLESFAREASALDSSLPQIVESARGKMDYQLARLLEGLAGKARHRMEREHPEWLRLRYYLSPGDRLQERRLASLEPVAYRGPGVVNELCNLAEGHAEKLENGRYTHDLLEL